MLISFFIKFPPENFALYLFDAIFVLLVQQTVSLLPLLEDRAQQIIKGIGTLPSKNHLIYIAFERLKFLPLISGVNLLNRNLRLYR